MTKLKAFADDKIKGSKYDNFSGCQHFLLFPQCFPKPSFGTLKVGIVWLRVNQRFLLFQQCFLSLPKQIQFFSQGHFVVCKCFQYGESKTLLFAKEYKQIILSSNGCESYFSISMGESNTVVCADTMYRHLQQYCSHPSI